MGWIKNGKAFYSFNTIFLVLDDFYIARNNRTKSFMPYICIDGGDTLAVSAS
jgi:hypothetical protein